MRDEKQICDLDCLCFKRGRAKVAVQEVILKHVEEMKKKQEARRKLVKSLEDAGVNLPVTAFELMLNRDDLEGDYSYYLGARGKTEDEVAPNPFLKDTDDDRELQGVPEDLRNLLLRSAEAGQSRTFIDLEAPLSAAKGSSLHSTTETDEESDPDMIEIPHAPLGSTKRGGVTVVETDDTVEAQDAHRSKFALASKNSKRVTMIFPKDKNRRMHMGIAFCCLLQLALVGVVLYFAVFRETSALDIASPSEDTEMLASNLTATLDPLVPVAATNATAVPIEVDTVAVTDAPTGAPTGAPTLEVTEPGCLDSVVPNTQCYPRGRQIVVLFTTCEPREEDWMGIYDASITPTELGDDYIDWMWTCGNKECRGLVSSNMVAFMDIFPPGTYRLHLIRGSSEGVSHSAYATSEVFEIKDNLLDCSA
jgi:hypothetical protein